MEVNTQLKCVAVGDGTVGKTCLLMKYAKDDFPNGYVPTVFDSHEIPIPINDSGIVNLFLFDIAGNEGYEDLRQSAYHNTDIYLLCYSVENKASFENIPLAWFPDIKKATPDATIILVATKIDLRETKGNCLTTFDGEKLAKQLKIPFVECSAYAGENVNEVFTTGLQLALEKKGFVGTEKKGCLTMLKEIFCL